MYGIDYCARFGVEIVVDIQSLLLEKVSQLKHNNRYLLIVADAQKSQKLATPPHTAQRNTTAAKYKILSARVMEKYLRLGTVEMALQSSFAEITQFIRCTNFILILCNVMYLNFM